MDEKDIYTPAEAVQYLREKRGIVFTVDGLRNRRRNKQAQAHRVLTSITLWTKEELDAIEPSRKTKRVPIDEEANGETGNPSVMLMEFHVLPQPLVA